MQTFKKIKLKLVRFIKCVIQINWLKNKSNCVAYMLSFERKLERCMDVIAWATSMTYDDSHHNNMREKTHISKTQVNLALDIESELKVLINLIPILKSETWCVDFEET